MMARSSIRIGSFFLMMGWIAIRLHAVQVTDLVPINPVAEQGQRRDVLVGFGRRVQDEQLPPPKQGVSDSAQSLEDISPKRTSADAGLDGEEIRQRYPDGKTQVLRHVRQDADGNFVNHGSWKLYNRRGQVMAEGNYVDGLMDGTWSRWHADDDPRIRELCQTNVRTGPYLSVATFVHGKLDGSWIIYDRNRQKILEIHYLDGVRHGPATWWHANGQPIREMRFDHGLIDGQLVEYDANNRPVKQTTFIRGRRVYPQVTWYADKRKQTEDFYLDAQLVIDGDDDWWNAMPASYTSVGTSVRQGAAQAWYSNGQLHMSGQYRDGQRDGTFTWWHPNGQKQLVAQYVAGNKAGVWTWWHANGIQSVQGSYKDDFPDGEWVYWNEDGKVLRRGAAGSDALEVEPQTFEVEQTLHAPLDNQPPLEEIAPPDADEPKLENRP